MHRTPLVDLHSRQLNKKGSSKRRHSKQTDLASANLDSRLESLERLYKKGHKQERSSQQNQMFGKLQEGLNGLSIGR